MSDITPQLPDFSGLTFEKVWAMFQETGKQIRELREQSREIAERFRETDEKFKETERQMEKSRVETNRQMKETHAEMKEIHAETERAIKDFAKSVNEFKGDISNRLGEVAEHLVAPHIKEKFNELGFDFSESAVNVKVKDKETHKTRLQIDILLENGNSVVAVEVKTKPTVADVKEFSERLAVFRECRNERPRGEQRAIYGALAGAVFQQHVKDAALKAGFFIITQSGDTMQIENPKEFKPKKF